MQRKSKSSDNDDNLQKRCEVYKARWEDAIRTDLIQKLAGNGLSEVKFDNKDKIKEQADIDEFGAIKQAVAAKLASLRPGQKLESLSINEKTELLDSKGFDFIINNVIKREPSAQFRAVHQELYSALQRYRAASALLIAGDDLQFRKAFVSSLLGLQWDKDKDPETQKLISDIKKMLGVNPSRIRMYSSAPTVAESANDAKAAVSNPSVRPRSASKD
jgi:hypothetical protein